MPLAALSVSHLSNREFPSLHAEPPCSHEAGAVPAAAREPPVPRPCVVIAAGSALDSCRDVHMDALSPSLNQLRRDDAVRVLRCHGDCCPPGPGPRTPRPGALPRQRRPPLMVLRLRRPWAPPTRQPAARRSGAESRLLSEPGGSPGPALGVRGAAPGPGDREQGGSVGGSPACLTGAGFLLFFHERPFLWNEIFLTFLFVERA